MKKFVSFGVALCLMLSLVACGGSEENASQPAGSSEAQGQSQEQGQTGDETFLVGICQLVQHDALDSATKGFKDALTEALGDKVSFDEQNASGESVNCTTIVNGFIAKDVDLIMANATPAVTAAAAATDTIPILGTSVTAYPVALEIPLDQWTGTVGNNISGTSDLADLEAQAKMIKEWFPEAKNVGLLFCSAEANSEFQVSEMEKYFADLGLTGTRFAFTDTNDVAAVTQAACDASDVIFIPTDNTAASNAEAIANIVIPAAVPVIAGESNICKGCGVATISIDYYDLGVATGKMAVKILTGEADVKEMPIEYSPELVKLYNADICEKLGISPVEGYEPIQ